MASLPVTAIILVGQKTRRLEEVIDSLAWVSEIVCYDNNSGVNFTSFRESKLKIVHGEEGQIKDFSAVRQALQGMASEPWVFFVDSDEVVIVEDAAKFESQLENPTLHGLSVVRSDVFLGQALEYGEAGERVISRLTRPGFGVWKNPVHEVLEVQGGVAVAPIRLAHYSHETISEFIAQVIEYAKLAASAKQSTPIRNLLELLFFPPLKLFYGLVIQGGLLDGWRGVVYAFCMSLHSIMVRVYWYEIHRVVGKPRA